MARGENGPAGMTVPQHGSEFIKIWHCCTATFANPPD
jgi:hypothetical protein